MSRVNGGRTGLEMTVILCSPDPGCNAVAGRLVRRSRSVSAGLLNSIIVHV